MTVSFRPVSQPVAHIVYLPPFGEEMNRCRALVAEQARRFAASGLGCTVLDYFGTGDSEGELQDASLEIWHANIECVIDALRQEDGVPIILWGLRLGALIALEHAARAVQPISQILLWEPITSGKRYVTQLLRQRVASLVGRNLPPETTQEIRQRIAAGERVEISGYTVGRELIQGIEDIGTQPFGKLCPGKIFWLENITEEGQEISAGSKKIVASLEAGGNEVEVRVFSDPPIWQLHKRDEAPQLLDLTTNLLTS